MAATTQSTSPGGAVRWRAAVVRTRGIAPGPALLGLLLVAILYAAFASGATAVADESRLQVGLAAAATAACAAWLWGSGLRVSAPVGAWVAVGLLAGFAVWSGLSLVWSVDPDRTWLELNRAIAYTLAIGMAVVAAASYSRARERFAAGYLGIAVLVALYALGGKVLPGLHIAHLFDLNQTENFSRLRAPLQYWNALGLFCVLAVPLAMHFAVATERERRVRLAALGSLQLLLVTIGLTYSRGAIVSLIVGLAVGLWLSHARLRSLLMVALAVAAAGPALAYAFIAKDLTTNGVPLAERSPEGIALGLLLFGAMAALLLVGTMILALEERTTPDPARSRRVAMIALAAVAIVAVIGLGSVATSNRGLFGTISDQVDAFTTPRAADQFDPARLLATNSGNRWVWWKEAVGAWSDRPLRGWGAGSFPVMHREYRKQNLDVQQPHSVPLQFLAETGLVGALLAMGGLLLALWTGLAGVRRLRAGPSREIGAALVAGSVAFVVHGLYDWDWDIPGVAIPALVMLGILAAGAPGEPEAEPAPDPDGDDPSAQETLVLRPLGARPAAAPARVVPNRLRVAGLALATVLACTVAASALLPAWADTRAAAVVTDLSENPSAADLVAAERRAEYAARLNPLGVRALISAAVISQRRGRLGDARDHLLEATRRAPNSRAAWFELARIELLLGDQRGIALASRKTTLLDPLSPASRKFVRAAATFSTPPSASATAAGTPLPVVVGNQDQTSPPGSSFPPWLYGAESSGGLTLPGSSISPEK